MQLFSIRNIFVGCVSAVIATTASAQQGIVPHERNCVLLELTSVENPDGWHQEKFAAHETSDLYFNYLFPQDLQGEHLITLRIYTPRGHLYRQLDSPVRLGARGAAGERQVAGYPYPVKVLGTTGTVMDERSFERARSNFPIAGTAIVTSSLYGVWKVEILVDGALQDCTKPVEFRIVE